MTMSKQTTIAGADDSLSSLENGDDFQTDGFAHSLTSSYIEKEFGTLSISGPKAGENVFSCESGIASLSENDSVRTVTTGESELKLENRNSMGDGQWLTRCVNDNTADKTDTKSDSTDVAEVDADDKLNSREKSKVLCWDEMCEAFPDKDGDTVLHLAVLHAVARLPDVVRLLGLQREVNWRNRLYQTPLHLAVLTANTQAAAALLALGASLSAQDSHGNTPLHTACQRNDLHTLNALLHDVRSDGWDGAVAGSASKTDDYTTRTEVLGSDDHDEEERGVARQRRGREVRAALCMRNYEGFTCLHLAVLHRAHDLVTLLLRHGADVNAMDAKSGRTALHFAVDSTSPSLSVISTLLRQPQLRINATNFAQQTALELARGRNHLDLVDLLHLHGAEWSNRIHGYYSSDSFSEDDIEGELGGPYDDICVAGQLVSNARLR